MNAINELRFALSDRIHDVVVSPAHVPLALLGEFQKDVSQFLRGSGCDVDPMQVNVSIEDGSLALVASGLIAATTLWADLEYLKSPTKLGLIDPKRADVVAGWQSAAKQHPNRRYAVQGQDGAALFFVDITTDYHRAEDAWVSVEKYLHGKIVDWGGKTKANVHLELENGKTVKVESSQDLIAREEHNLVYRQALLHVSAEENLMTADLRNLRLLAFEHHQPNFDENEFKLMVERGTRAWADVDNTSAWLENLRGNA